jgi:hypothetical protein
MGTVPRAASFSSHGTVTSTHNGQKRLKSHPRQFSSVDNGAYAIASSLLRRSDRRNCAARLGIVTTTLLAHLAARFSDRPETLATEGLGYLLSASHAAKDSLRYLLADWGVEVPEGIGYRTEVVDESGGGRPDVVGTSELRRIVILEGKFWAPLMETQPVEYLNSLSQGGALLFVAPSIRLPTIWAELERRCVRAFGGMDGREVSNGQLGFTGGRWLGIVSWAALLDRLRRALLDAGEDSLAYDAVQLEGLAAQMDTDAFLPLASEDLYRPTPLLVFQFMELLELLVRRGVAEGLFSTKGLRVGGKMGQYIRYVAHGPFQLGLMVDLKRWGKQRATPFWVELALEPGDALKSLELEIPPRVFYDGHAARPVVPLSPALHEEQDAVISDLIDQLRELMSLVSDCKPTVQLQTP